MIQERSQDETRQDETRHPRRDPKTTKPRKEEREQDKGKAESKSDTLDEEHLQWSDTSSEMWKHTARGEPLMTQDWIPFPPKAYFLQMQKQWERPEETTQEDDVTDRESRVDRTQSNEEWKSDQQKADSHHHGYEIRAPVMSKYGPPRKFCPISEEHPRGASHKEYSDEADKTQSQLQEQGENEETPEPEIPQKGEKKEDAAIRPPTKQGDKASRTGKKDVDEEEKAEVIDLTHGKPTALGTSERAKSGTERQNQALENRPKPSTVYNVFTIWGDKTPAPEQSPQKEPESPALTQPEVPMIQVTKPQWGKKGKGKGKDKDKGKGKRPGKSALRTEGKTSKGKESEAKGQQEYSPSMRRTEEQETSDKEEESKDLQPDEPPTIFPWRDTKKQKGEGKKGAKQAPKGRKEWPSHKGLLRQKGEQQQKGYKPTGDLGDFMNPPSDLRALTETWRGYKREERDRTLYFLEHDPDSLKDSLRVWLVALFNEGPCSMKRVNFLLFCQRAIKIQEFVELNGNYDTLLRAVAACCGRYPNDQLKRDEEEKILLRRMCQQEKNRARCKRRMCQRTNVSAGTGKTAARCKGCANNPR